MTILPSIEALRSYRHQLCGSVGFVPTMGALHEGHASLVRRSIADNDHTIVSIFVNHTQFGPNEDFDTYPRTLEADVELLKEQGADAIFTPAREEIYPGENAQISFQIHDLDKILCGASRPGHMNAVVQIVSILFHLVQPDKAYFGRKDYQQFLILQTMARELHFPVEVVPCPIVREKDGLAMSSRNRNLSPEERRQALFLFHTIQKIRNKHSDWRSDSGIQEFAKSCLAEYPLVTLDYIEVLNGQTLQHVETLTQRAHPHIFLAAWLGKTRLIDNAPLYGDD